MKSVLRYDVPIDDQPHEVPACTFVGFARGPAHQPNFGFGLILDLWLEVPGDVSTAYDGPTMQVQIVGTSQPVDDAWTFLGSTVDGKFVWHLYRLPDQEVADAGDAA